MLGWWLLIMSPSKTLCGQQHWQLYPWNSAASHNEICESSLCHNLLPLWWQSSRFYWAFADSDWTSPLAPHSHSIYETKGRHGQTVSHTFSHQSSFLFSSVAIKLLYCNWVLGSKNAGLLSQNKLGGRAFPYQAPLLRDHLPTQIREAISVKSLKSKLKT